MNRNIISYILKAGTVVMTSVLSFVIKPPALVPDENSGLNWKNAFTFIAGVLSVVLLDRYRSQGKGKAFPLLITGALVALLVSYEICYSKYSISCYDHYRIVVSPAPIKPELKAFFDANFGKKPDPVKEFLQSRNCVSTVIWEESDLYPYYYGMIALYLAIIVLVILLLALLSASIKDTSQTTIKP